MIIIEIILRVEVGVICGSQDWINVDQQTVKPKQAVVFWVVVLPQAYLHYRSLRCPI